MEIPPPSSSVFKRRFRFWLIAVGLSSLMTYFLVNPRPWMRTPAQIEDSPTASLLPPPPEISKQKPSLSRCKRFYETVCSQSKAVRDPTGYVLPGLQGEILALRILEETIREHPDWTVEELDQAFGKRIFTAKVVKQIQGTFTWTQTQMIDLIQGQPEALFTATQKNLLIQRIRGTRLKIPPAPELLSQTDVTYEPLEQGPDGNLQIGGAFVLAVKSKFNVIFTLAHELGHAIDPCTLQSKKIESSKGFSNLVACLEDRGFFKPKKASEACPPVLAETFADWLATQITARALKAFAYEFEPTQVLAASSNAVRDLCEEESDIYEEEKGTHPTPRDRIEKLFGGHPIMQGLLGCQPGAPQSKPYCGFETTP